MHVLRIISYAKINLTLDVYGIRADGYHDLASVMQAVSLQDELQIYRTESNSISFTCDADPSFNIPADSTNLVVRAAERTLEAIGEKGAGLAIHLDKHIPAQAGLGGGSSDAASAIFGVNQSFGNPLPMSKLSDIGASLGSDVPFFLMGGTAVALGRGEQLIPLLDIPKTWLVIVKPQDAVSTAWAYNLLDNVPNRESHEGTERMAEAIEKEEMDRIISGQCNDFEAPVFDHFPKIAWLHDELRLAGAITAHLCGSGSAVYGVMENESAANRAFHLLKGRYPYTYMAHTLSRNESLPRSEVFE